MTGYSETSPKKDSELIFSFLTMWVGVAFLVTMIGLVEFFFERMDSGWVAASLFPLSLSVVRVDGQSAIHLCTPPMLEDRIAVASMYRGVLVVLSTS